MLADCQMMSFMAEITTAAVKVLRNSNLVRCPPRAG